MKGKCLFMLGMIVLSTVANAKEPECTLSIRPKEFTSLSQVKKFKLKENGDFLGYANIPLALTAIVKKVPHTSNQVFLSIDEAKDSVDSVAPIGLDGKVPSLLWESGATAYSLSCKDMPYVRSVRNSPYDPRQE